MRRVKPGTVVNRRAWVGWQYGWLPALFPLRLSGPRRRLGPPPGIKSWSLTSFEQRLMKTGGRLVKHARYSWLLVAEGHLNRRLFGDMLHRIWALPLPSG